MPAPAASSAVSRPIAPDPDLEGSAPRLEVEGHDVRVDPYGRNPLCAVVNLRGIDEREVRGLKVVVAGRGGGADLVRHHHPGDPAGAARYGSEDLRFPERGLHVPVIGLHADGVSEVRLLVDVGVRGRVDLRLPIETRLARAGEAAWVPAVRVHAAAPERMEPGWTVAEVNFESNYMTVDWMRAVAFDERGAIRWALRLDELTGGATFPLSRLPSGTLLAGASDTVVEVNALGRILRTIRLPGYTVHHELLAVGDDLIVLATRNDASTIEDRMLRVDPGTGRVLHEWDLADAFDLARTTFVDAQGFAPEKGDWLHANGIAWSGADDTFIVSARQQGVAKVDRAGELIWLLAPHRGWRSPHAERLLTAVAAGGAPYPAGVQDGGAGAADGSFDWPFGQHTPVLLPNGDLLLFDNGANRHFAGGCGASRAVIYRIDEPTRTVRQVGQLAFPRARSSFFVSSASHLPSTGNVLVQPGGTHYTSDVRSAVVTEVATEVAADGTIGFGATVFDATVDLGLVQAGSIYSYRAHRWQL